MARMSASLVVSILEGRNDTGRLTRSLTRLERAERDVMLARTGQRLTREQIAQERLIAAREADQERLAAARERRLAMMGRMASLGLTAAGYAAMRSYRSYAELERRVGRIVLNADKGAEAIGPTISALQNIAQQTAQSFDDMVAGVETLVASGRSLEEAMAFLPSVALTAQASGAAISDIALSADAMSGALKINAANMQRAFDILVAGGKAGKFELKDMAQYLPSLLPAFAALGYEGEAGLKKIVAMLQVARNQTGDASSAATNLQNVFQKMTSEQTVKAFAKMGIKDLRGQLDRARKAGKDVLDVFLDIAQAATKGDASKINLLFTDQQMQMGMRALMSQRQELEKLNAELGRVDGSALRDFNTIVEDSQSKIERLSTLWSKFATQVGSGVATAVNPALDSVTSALDREAAARLGREKLYRDNPALEAATRDRYLKRYQELHGRLWLPTQRRDVWQQALAEVGRGNRRSVFDGLEGPRLTELIEDRASREPNRGRPAQNVPTPRPRLPHEMSPAERMREAYRYGSGREGLRHPNIARFIAAQRQARLDAIIGGPSGMMDGAPARPTHREEREWEPRARPTRAPIGAPAREAEAASMQALRRDASDVAAAIEDALASGATRLADGGEGIRKGASDGAAEMVRAGQQVGQDLVAAGQQIAAAIRAAVANISVSVSQPGRPLGAQTTGQAIRDATRGQFIDYGPKF